MSVPEAVLKFSFAEKSVVFDAFSVVLSGTNKNDIWQCDMSDLFLTPGFILFVILFLGLVIGNLRFRGVSLDVSAVLFVALILGHFGLTLPPVLQQVGLLLFIFTIGIQAGPGFFESFRKHGMQMLVLVSVVVMCGAVLSVLAHWIFHIRVDMVVGMFTGALTSTPGLAAAIESTGSPVASIGYGIAYPFGVIGVILYVRLMPKLLKIDLNAAEAESAADIRSDFPDLVNRNFIVENTNVTGHTLGELNVRSMTEATVSRVMHNNVAITPTADTCLHKGDLIKAVGTPEALANIRLLIGPETRHQIPLNPEYDVRWVLVTNKKVVNQSLQRLNLMQNYNATVTRIRRSGIDITPSPQSQIRFGDKLMIAADRENLNEVVRLFGNNDRKLSDADFLPIAAGITLGLLVGQLTIPLPGGMNIKLGITGGVLTTALILSRLGKTGPVLWTLSGAANQILRELGLLLFLATVGAEAGQHLVDTLTRYGPELFVIRADIT